jgi:transketolase
MLHRLMRWTVFSYANRIMSKDINPEVPLSLRELRGYWMNLFAAYEKEFPELAAETLAIQHREPPEGWDAAIPTFPPDAKGIASRDSSGKVLRVLGPAVTSFCRADLIFTERFAMSRARVLFGWRAIRDMAIDDDWAFRPNELRMPTNCQRPRSCRKSD